MNGAANAGQSTNDDQSKIHRRAPLGNLKQRLFRSCRFLSHQLVGAKTEIALAVNDYSIK